MTTAVVRPARRKLLTVGVALLAAVIACLTLTATPAHAGAENRTGHRPLACKIASGFGADPCSFYFGRASGGSVEPSGVLTFGYDATIYKDFKDFSVYAPLSNPALFPKSNGGYVCSPGGGGAACVRSGADAPKPGKAGATVGQLRDYAWRGDLVSFEEDDSTACVTTSPGNRGCFMADFQFTYYEAQAIYSFDRTTGELSRPSITWWDKKGKLVGHSKQFLTIADSYTEFAAPGSMYVTSFSAPERAASIGSDVTYGVSLTAMTSGSAVVDLQVLGLTGATEAVIPSDWVRYSSLDASTIRYIVPYIAAGDIQSASLHFKAGAEINSVNVVVHAQTDVTSEAVVDVVPSAPVCTVPNPAPVVQRGGEATLLSGGTHCDAPAGSVLTTRYDPAANGDLTMVQQPGSPLVYQLSYQARSADYTDVESVPVYAVSTANGEYSEPTMVDIRVVAPAEALADEYLVTAGKTLFAMQAQGVVANDQFSAGSEGWYAEQGAGPTHGSLTLSPNGSFQYTPVAGFSGDDSFRYRLGGPNGAHSEPVTVVIHVMAG